MLNVDTLVSVEMSLGCQATVQTSDRWGAQGYVVGLDGKPAGEPAQLCESRLSSRCSVLLLSNPCAERRRVTYLRLCADNLDAYTYESIIVGYFSLFRCKANMKGCPTHPGRTTNHFDHFRLNSSGELWPLSTE